MLLKGIRDLAGQALLHLGPLGEAVDESGDLGKPDHVAAAVRDVGDVRFPMKGIR